MLPLSLQDDQIDSTDLITKGSEDIHAIPRYQTVRLREALALRSRNTKACAKAYLHDLLDLRQNAISSRITRTYLAPARYKFNGMSDQLKAYNYTSA